MMVIVVMIAVWTVDMAMVVLMIVIAVRAVYMAVFMRVHAYS